MCILVMQSLGVDIYGLYHFDVNWLKSNKSLFIGKKKELGMSCFLEIVSEIYFYLDQNQGLCKL